MFKAVTGYKQLLHPVVLEKNDFCTSLCRFFGVLFLIPILSSFLVSYFSDTNQFKSGILNG
jgi:hypothetical protein